MTAQGKTMVSGRGPVPPERQVEAIRTLVETVAATRGGAAAREAALAPQILDVLDALPPGDAALFSEFLMGMAFRAGGTISERYPYIEFAIHLARAALGDDGHSDPTSFLRSRLPGKERLDTAVAALRASGAAIAAGDPEPDQDHILRALTLGTAMIECLSHGDTERGRLAAAGMLFAAAAQILTMRAL
jgi:hypothetical protein